MKTWQLILILIVIVILIILVLFLLQDLGILSIGLTEIPPSSGPGGGRLG